MPLMEVFMFELVTKFSCDKGLSHLADKQAAQLRSKQIWRAKGEVIKLFSFAQG